MNPPISEDEQEGYIGSEPLDPALADRFAFIVRMPAWDQFSEIEQLSIIKTTGGAAPTIEASEALQRIILTTRLAIPKVKDAIGENVAVYVRGLVEENRAITQRCMATEPGVELGLGTLSSKTDIRILSKNSSMFCPTKDI